MRPDILPKFWVTDHGTNNIPYMQKIGHAESVEHHLKLRLRAGTM